MKLERSVLCAEKDLKDQRPQCPLVSEPVSAMARSRNKYLFISLIQSKVNDLACQVL